MSSKPPRSLTTIYLTRHGFRSNWVVDPATGTYSSNIPTPTGIPSDPALAGYGEAQARELGEHLSKVDPPIERIYSSPFYRCIQTISPLLPHLSDKTSDPPNLKIRGENGLGEWYGLARFDHPSPASPELLHSFFPAYDKDYVPKIRPSVNGESIEDLHDRTAYALHRVIEEADKEGVKAIVICTHAATLIAIGRCLTGRMPDNVGEEDFRPFTCGLSIFERKESGSGEDSDVAEWKGPEEEIPQVGWRDGKGVGGGWIVKSNGDCSFLSGGEERGWRFSGDESFSTNPGQGAAGLDAGSGLGVVIEGNKPDKTTEPSRL
ncbi:phosphoglycerate mutase protein [Rutstroemia sp. NJR-2017a BBW]|nr:phosphoglycerate mutase protein [Rutstroemia sp. NJR-2017a BBW]